MADLLTFLKETFESSGGELSFEEFMAMALYDPVFGYYTTGISDVGGRRGDFATAATLSDGAGRAVAGWVKEEIRHHQWKGTIPLIEVGGGNGALAGAVLDSLGWRGRRRVSYHLVEVSPLLREKQQTRLGRFAASWHDDVTSALRESQGKALIFSNELVDAFPAKWLRWNAHKGAWQEIFVTFDPATGLRERFRDCAPELTPAIYSAMALSSPPDGQRIEILPSFRRWLTELSLHWKNGSMLTIDYGGTKAGEIYHRRPHGTMRAYLRQERIEGSGIYSRIGRQDLTADVNFGDLVQWGKELGMKFPEISTQGDFLGRFGLDRDQMAGDGAREAFQVLAWRL